MKYVVAPLKLIRMKGFWFYCVFSVFLWAAFFVSSALAQPIAAPSLPNGLPATPNNIANFKAGAEFNSEQFSLREGLGLGDAMNFDDCLDFSVSLCFNFWGPCRQSIPLTFGLIRIPVPSWGPEFEYREPIALVESMCTEGKSYMGNRANISSRFLMSAFMNNDSFMECPDTDGDGEPNCRCKNDIKVSGPAPGIYHQQFRDVSVWGISPIARYLSSADPMEATQSLICGYAGMMGILSRGVLAGFSGGLSMPGNLISGWANQINDGIEGTIEGVTSVLSDPSTLIQTLSLDAGSFLDVTGLTDLHSEIFTTPGQFALNHGYSLFQEAGDVFNLGAKAADLITTAAGFVKDSGFLCEAAQTLQQADLKTAATVAGVTAMGATLLPILTGDSYTGVKGDGNPPKGAARGMLVQVPPHLHSVLGNGYAIKKGDGKVYSRTYNFASSRKLIDNRIKEKLLPDQAAALAAIEDISGLYCPQTSHGKMITRDPASARGFQTTYRNCDPTEPRTITKGKDDEVVSNPRYAPCASEEILSNYQIDGLNPACDGWGTRVQTFTYRNGKRRCGKDCEEIRYGSTTLEFLYWTGEKNNHREQIQQNTSDHVNNNLALAAGATAAGLAAVNSAVNTLGGICDLATGLPVGDWGVKGEGLDQLGNAIPMAGDGGITAMGGSMLGMNDGTIGGVLHQVERLTQMAGMVEALTSSGGVQNALLGFATSFDFTGLWPAYISVLGNRGWRMGESSELTMVRQAVGFFGHPLCAVGALASDLGLAGAGSTLIGGQAIAATNVIPCVGVWGVSVPYTGHNKQHRDDYVSEILIGWRGLKMAEKMGSLPIHDEAASGEQQQFNLDHPHRSSCFSEGTADLRWQSPHASIFGGGLLDMLEGNNLATIGEGLINAPGKLLDGLPSYMAADEGMVSTWWKRTKCCIYLVGGPGPQGVTPCWEIERKY